MTAVTQPVVIVGGGLAGLCCAKRLWEEGVPSLILEASDDILRTSRICSRSSMAWSGLQTLCRPSIRTPVP